MQTLLMTNRDAQMLSPLQLAFIGDSVHDLLACTRLISTGKKAHELHLAATRLVNATAQAAALSAISGSLTEEETAIVRRGRNAHPRHPVPQSATAEDYSNATGFEALLGFLYLTGREQRLNDIFSMTL
jgi:ribonuclease III family protein